MPIKITLGEGEGIEIRGVPLVVVRARGKRLVVLIASATGNEMDGPLPLESLETVRAAARRLQTELTDGHDRTHNNRDN